MSLRYSSVDDLPPAIRKQIHDRMENAEPIQNFPRPKARRDDEHNAQVVFFNRLAAIAVNEPSLALAVSRTHAIPNGGRRTRREGARLKSEGVRRGVPDIFCAYPASGYHGLYIEMKSLTGRLSDEQKKFIEDCKALGYATCVAYSADEAFKAWMDYVSVR